MQTVQQELSALELHLQDLREQSLKMVVLIPGLAGYALLVWGGWLAAEPLPLLAWLGILLLIACTSTSLLLLDQRLNLAARILVWGMLAAVTCAVIAYPSAIFTTLLILPIIFASVLMEGGIVFVIAGIAEGVVLLTIRRTGEAFLPLTIIPLVAIVAWLSVRNLYTTLAWVWNGYERALRNENEAREQEAELKRALKALDEATYRLHRANYMITLARDQAETTRRLKQQFAQTISHELRTPLNLIVSFTEVMLQSPEYYGSPLPAPYLRDLGIVYRNAGHLQGLVNDVLDLARIEAAQMSLSPEKVSPTKLAHDALTTIRGLVESRGLALHADIAADLEPIWLDPTRIRQVLFNLVTNAVRFTERGGITVGVRAEDEQILFWVQDTGIGIAPADQERIFEEFQQLDSSSSRPHQGMGLGLTISKRFVELHKGRIWVESSVGEGSTFYFTLPRETTEKVLSGVLSHTLQVEGVKSTESPILLVITRSPSAATLLARYMRGFRTATVLDLEQARLTVNQLKPQLVVIDNRGEDVDGEMLDRLAVEWDLPRALLLACPLPGEEVMRQQLDADGYLVKPVSRQSLWDTLRRFGEAVDDILVIDDDRDFMFLLSRLLEDNPVRRYRVRGANSGQEGLVMMEYAKPDLVLLDLMLPDISGVQVLERIQDREEWGQIPVVIVSAQDQLDEQTPNKGPLIVSRGEGLRPGEIVKWMQAMTDMLVTQDPTPPEL